VVEDGVPVALIPPTGRPVAFVKVTEVGVPRTGVTSVGLVASTLLPVPVFTNSPTKPALSYRTRPDVPPVIAVVPTVNPPPLTVAHDPSPRR